MSTEPSHDERAFRFAPARMGVPDDGAEQSSAVTVPDWPSSVLYPPLSEDPEEGNR